MALTNWNDILNKPKGIDEVPEIALTVEQLSASVLSISEDVGEIAEDVQEIALEVSQLSASTLPYSDIQSIKDVIDSKQNQVSTVNITFRYSNYGLWLKTNFSTGRQIIGVINTDYMVVDGGATSSYARIYSVGPQSITPAPTTNEITLKCVVIDI